MVALRTAGKGQQHFLREKPSQVRFRLDSTYLHLISMEGAWWHLDGVLHDGKLEHGWLDAPLVGGLRPGCTGLVRGGKEPNLGE